MSATLSDLRPPAPATIKRSRLPGVIFVIVFHAFAIYALWSGLGSTAIDLVTSLDAVVLDAAEDIDVAPPPPPPDYKPPPPVVAPPEIAIDLTAATNTTAITQVTDEAPPEPITAPRPSRRNTIPDSAYPPISRRLNEEGRVILRITVGTDGKASSVEVSKSSGFPRLDDAAVEYVRDRWSWTPAKQGDNEVAATIQVAVNWELK